MGVDHGPIRGPHSRAPAPNADGPDACDPWLQVTDPGGGATQDRGARPRFEARRARRQGSLAMARGARFRPRSGRGLAAPISGSIGSANQRPPRVYTAQASGPAALVVLARTTHITRESTPQCSTPS